MLRDGAWLKSHSPTFHRRAEIRERVFFVEAIARAAKVKSQHDDASANPLVSDGNEAKLIRYVLVYRIVVQMPNDSSATLSLA